MAVDFAHREALGFIAESYLAANTLRVMLTNNLVISPSTSKAAIVAAELLQQNGYSRQLYSPSAGAFNPTRLRYEIPVVINTFTSSVDTQWSGKVLWSGGSATSSKPVASIDPTANRLTVTAHGRSNGDELVITSEDTLAAGIPANTIVYAKSIDANTLELYTTSALSSIVDISDVGVGTHHIRIANGYPLQFSNFDPQILVATVGFPTQTYFYFSGGGNTDGIES